MKLQAPSSKLQENAKQTAAAASPSPRRTGRGVGVAEELARQRQQPSLTLLKKVWTFHRASYPSPLIPLPVGRGEGNSATSQRRSRAFTLIEVMVVVVIIGLIMALGGPSLYKMMKKEGMRKAVDELEQAFRNARGRAILTGQTVLLEFRPLERSFQIVGGASAPVAASPQDGFDAPPTPSQPTGGLVSGGTLPEGVTIEMLDINLLSFRESDFARIRFFPNGTCDECRLVIVSQDDVWRGIELENTTGVPNVVTDLDSMRSWGGM